MRTNRWGRVINVFNYGLDHLTKDVDSPMEYIVEQGGKSFLLKYFALREKEFNITVNLINPGSGHTSQFTSVDISDSVQQLPAEWEKRKELTPQDIAETVLFLCEERARFITGSQIAFSLK
jgi:NAD(P)-dependent dehydrogenase (short-subunit alcohol dehydrogenase family)